MAILLSISTKDKKEQTGEPGKSLRFEDLTPEQIEQLKGPKGDKGEAFYIC